MISDKKSVDSKFNNHYLASSLKWLNTIAWLVLDSIGELLQYYTDPVVK